MISRSSMRFSRCSDKLFDTLAAAIKSQIKRVKAKTTTTRSSILYLTIINETKTMVAANPEPAQVAALFHVRGVGPAFAGLYLAAVRRRFKESKKRLGFIPTSFFM